jgi:hypothetical protein
VDTDAVIRLPVWSFRLTKPSEGLLPDWRYSRYSHQSNRPYPLSLGVQNLVLPVSLQDEPKLKVPTQESITTKDEEYLEEIVDESNKAQNFKTVTCPATFFPGY